MGSMLSIRKPTTGYIPLLRHQEAQETSSHEINVREIARVLAELFTADKVAFSRFLIAELGDES